MDADKLKHRLQELADEAFFDAQANAKRSEYGTALKQYIRNEVYQEVIKLVLEIEGAKLPPQKRFEDMKEDTKDTFYKARLALRKHILENKEQVRNELKQMRWQSMSKLERFLNPFFLNK